MDIKTSLRHIRSLVHLAQYCPPRLVAAAAALQDLSNCASWRLNLGFLFCFVVGTIWALRLRNSLFPQNTLLL